MIDEVLLRDQINFVIQCGLFEDIGRRIAEGFVDTIVSPENVKKFRELAEALDPSMKPCTKIDDYVYANASNDPPRSTRGVATEIMENHT